MRKIYAFLVLTFFAFQVRAQYVNIPDANLRTWLQNNGYASCIIGTTLDTTCAAVVNATRLNMQVPIQNLDGIQYFDNLQSLRISGAALNNIVAFPPSIDTIDIASGSGGGGLLNVPVIPPSCLYLKFEHYTANLPILPAGITYLNLSVNTYLNIPDSVKIFTLDGDGPYNNANYNGNNDTVYTFPNSIKNITLRDNRFSTIPPIPAGVENITLTSNTNLTSVSGPTLTNIKAISCVFNPIASFPNVASPAMYGMRISYSNLTNLPTINTTSSVELIFDNNDITSITIGGISQVPNLTRLDCSNNYISAISISGIQSTYFSLNASFNNLTSLPSISTAANTNVQVNCSNNNLSGNIVLNGYVPRLLGLEISDNNVTSIDTIPTTLSYLYCSYNSLSSLPSFANNTAGSFDLNCKYNFLTSLPPLPSNSRFVECDHNFIQTIQTVPSGIPQMQILNCGNNLLTSISSQIGYVRKLYCDSNQLTSISVPAVTLLDARQNNIGSLTNMLVRHDGFLVGGTVYMSIDVSDNLNLTCLPNFENGTIDEIFFNNTMVQCKPRALNANSSSPSISSVPLCSFFFNPSGCPIGYDLFGISFLDTNNLCNTPTGIRYRNVKARLFNSSNNLIQQTFTDSAGYFTFTLPTTGLYYVKADTFQMPFNATCNSANFNFTGPGSLLSTPYYLPIKCKPGYDLAAQSIVQNGHFFPATVSNYVIEAGELVKFYTDAAGACYSHVPANLSITISGPASYHSSAGLLSPSNISGDTLTWYIPDISGINPRTSFIIRLATDTFAQIGQHVCLSVNISSALPGDNNSTNNLYTHCWPVVNSFDPNDKQVNPIGNVAEGEWLTYTVRFQNTGTAPAGNVVISDTLNANLDIATITFLGSSHNCVTQINGNAILFAFWNINLPDSFTSEALSHGYVQFKVKIKSNLTPGFIINNKAYIYFDFNSPVITNTVFNQNCQGPVYSIINSNICLGDFYNFIGQHIYDPGVYIDTISTYSGCDSIITLNLTMLNTSASSFSQTICANQTYLFNGANLNTPGTYRDTLVNSVGCDSIITLNLTVLNTSASSLNETICSNQVYSFNGLNLNTNGAYYDTLQNATGCDSIITLNLTVNNSSASSFNQSICNGSTYQFNGIALSTTGAYYDTLQTTAGCDSLITLNLTVNNTSASSFNQTICSNQTYLFNGANLNTTGTYRDTLVNSVGCDSIITLNLTVNNTASSSFSEVICGNETYLFNGINLTASGTYMDTLTTVNGCDSIVTLNLTALPAIPVTNYYDHFCFGDSITLNGITYTAAGQYFDTLTAVNGCDSVLRIELIESIVGIDTVYATLCNGNSFTYNGNTYPSAGVYSDTLVSDWYGCDSVYVTLILDTASTSYTALNVNHCGSAYNFNGQIITTGGVYYDTLQNAAGCDSVITLNIAINSLAAFSFSQTICRPLTYNFNGQALSESGTYRDTLQTINGCDSVVQLTLTVIQPLGVKRDSICVGDVYSFNGLQLSTTGIYYDTLTTAAGCDSTLIFFLTVVDIAVTDTVIVPVTDSIGGSIGITVGGGAQPYTYVWSDGSTTPSLNAQGLVGIYSVTVTDGSGCSEAFSFNVPFNIGVNDIQNNIAFTLLPNPATSTVTIQLQNLTGSTTLKLYNTIGEIVLQQTATQSTSTLDISTLAAGIYYVQVETPDGIGTRKLIVY